MATAEQLGEVAVRYLGTYRRLARSRVRQPDDADDVVQEALLLAHSRLAQFQGRSLLSTWVGTIVINCARMQWRKAVPPQVELYEWLVDPVLGPDAALLANERSQRLRAAIRTLSPSLRITTELLLRELTMQQIANALEVPIGTVKARLSRARKILRKRLKAEMQLLALSSQLSANRAMPPQTLKAER